MAPNNNFISSSSISIWIDDSEWIHRITSELEKPSLIDTGKIRPSIFKLPSSLINTKAEAYAPKEIGLGPYHHFRKDLYYRVEQKKLDAVKRILAPTNQVLNSQHYLILKLTEHDKVIRVFYEDCCFDLKGEVLAWLLVIDALFLLDRLSIYPDKTARECAGDIMMVENQIPLLLLWTIHKSVQQSCDFEHELLNAISLGILSCEPPDGVLLYKMLLTFCDQHSPFKLAKVNPIKWYRRSCHILDFMYNLIVCDDVSLFHKQKRVLPQVVDIVGQVMGMTGSQGIQKLFQFITSVPWEVIIGLFRKVHNTDDNKGQIVKKINIPPVSKLCDVGLVKFDLTTWRIDGVDHIGCIKDIRFNNKDLTFHLPVITLNKVDSEVILRNLVAHEELLGRDPRPIRIADYVDLMSGILRTTEDVSLLRKKNIMNGSLGDEKIVELFDGISKSTRDTNRSVSYLKSTIDAVNKHYDNRPKIKARRYMKKCLYTSWKLLVFMTTVFTVLQLIFKAFCGVYDCNNIFHHKGGVSAISISSADLGLEMFPAL